VRVIAFDTETNLIRPGRTAPPMTCMTWQEATDFENGVFAEAKICLHSAAYLLMKEWLADPEVLLVGHNVAFDMAVFCAEFPDLLPAVFAAYEADRITDTMLRAKIIDIATGRYRGFAEEQPDGSEKWIKIDYSLAVSARRYAEMPIKKEGFRMFYAPFRNVSLNRWTEHARDLQNRGAGWLSGASDAELDDLCAAFGDTAKFKKEVAGMIAARPEEAVSYPLDDARATMACFVAQQEDADFLRDEFRQARKAWWLHLTSAWGLRTSARGVASLQMQTEREAREIEAKLVASGLIRKDGTRDTKLAKARMLEACGWVFDEGQGKYVPRPCTKEGMHADCAEHPELHAACAKVLPLRLTDSGEPSLDSDACKAADDELLKLYAELTSLKTVLNKDIPALAKATVYPIHTRFDMAETTRTTSSGPNIQNWRTLFGIRECFVPRPGNVFYQADYSSFELCALAQRCLDLFGHSALADMLNAGIDPHSTFAAKLAGMAYADLHKAAKDKDHPLHDKAYSARQVAKAFDFGAPGGLGMKRKRGGEEATLITFARKGYGVEITHEELAEYGRTWHDTFPEMREYFAYVTSLMHGGEGTLECPRSGAIRGGVRYTSACNDGFQRLAANAAGRAGFLIARACYDDARSPLFGSRIVNFVHDEFIGEGREHVAADCAEELSRLMVLGASEWIPGVKLAAEPCLMRVWSKDAKTLRDAAGRLVPWSPKESVALAA
jgi:DNA polymerase-1